jgi:hypothetical protein
MQKLLDGQLAMLLQRPCLWLLFVAGAVAGCAVTPPPAPLPPASSPADLLRAATAGDTTAVAITAPTSHPTLPEFLGIPQCCGAIQICCSRAAAQIGFCFPGLGSFLEPTPPLLPITDPANLAADAPPAVQKAAEIKAQEDQAAQKIAALRYLATIGCGGCYPSVEDAFIASMEDCTEEVRYEAVKAIRDTTTKYCQFCNQAACCSEKIQKKLRELAYETDDNGCPKEPSDRVRRQARMALAQCGPPAPEPVEEPVRAPTEGPSEGPPAPVEGTVPPPEEPADVDEEDLEAEGPLTRTDAVPAVTNSTATTPPHVMSASPTGQPLMPASSQFPTYPWSVKR